MAVSTVSNSNSGAVVMAVDGVSPTLIPSKVMETPEMKRAPKKAKKDPAMAAMGAEAGMTDAPAGKSKKRAASKGPDDAAGMMPAADETCEGEKTTGDSPGALIVAKAVRTLLKNHTTPIHLGSDALPALNVKVTELIYEAIGRALANGRKTLKNSDF